MYTSVRRSRPLLRPRPVLLALALVLAGSLPVAAGSGDWASPKRVFTASGSPVQSMARDSNGAVHVATHRSSRGVWYVTNASGSWKECQVTAANDLQPSIAVSGSDVHIAFARFEAVGRGIYTASGSGCAWTVTKRYAGGSSKPSLGARGSKLSLAFNTDARKLKFMKGSAGVTTWTTKQTVDTYCCTSPPSLALTHTGSARIAYGDGTSRQNGLKYAVRTSSGWKKTKVARGRVKQVALTLDHTPGLFGRPPSSGPHIAYMVKSKGTYLSAKGASGTSGKWSQRFLGKSWGPVDVTHGSSTTQVVHTKSGSIKHARHSGGIWSGGTLTNSGSDTHPQLDGNVLTFTRGKGTAGVYYSYKK